jgi:hypothetical protein
MGRDTRAGCDFNNFYWQGQIQALAEWNVLRQIAPNEFPLFSNSALGSNLLLGVIR